jgi:hypothetical protein
MRSGATLVPLSDDVLGALSRAPSVETLAPILEPQLVVDLTPSQAEALQRWLQALLDELSPDDDRWLTCLHCLSRLAAAIGLSETEHDN